jgi:uncharacterized damage-inducible protein DinB
MPLDPSAIKVFAANERMNQLVLENLDPAAWTAKPPGGVRPIAAIFTHIHNVRTKWIRLSAPWLPAPAQLHRSRCTQEQARDGLRQSGVGCLQMLAAAADGRIRTFLRDGWAKPWPAGLEMLCYMLAHEAHHRGQVTMLARQLGYPLPEEVLRRLWNSTGKSGTAS